MKPTLKQIFDFGTEIVEKDTNRYLKSLDEYVKYKAKRYNINIIIYTCIIWFNYSKKEVAEYLNISIGAVYKCISMINNSKSKQDLSEELFNSLTYEENKSFIAFRSDILKRFRAEGGNIYGRRTKFEKWLINRLYETENK